MQDAEKRAACALHEQRAVERDSEALRGLYERAIEKPRALMPQLERLRKEHAVAFQKTGIANGIVQDQQQALREAETRFAVALQAYQSLQTQWRELSDLLREETNK